MPALPYLAMVAAEPSGDLLAGHLLDGIAQRWPGVRLAGIGGPQMMRRGFDAWWPQEKLAVRGYVEVLRHYPEIVGIRRALRQRLLRERPSLFVGVDAPDFNLSLEAALRQAGIRTVHFVCPSIWAWRAHRVELLRRAADHVLCIFPFEPELLARHGIASTYVGHPLAAVIPMEPDRSGARAQLGLSEATTVLAVLPGSRASEIDQLGAMFFDAAALVQAERPGIEVVVPVIATLRPAVERALARSKLQAGVRVVEGQSHAVLAACDLALVASGTATLEAALFKRPMVISYRVNALSWRFMRPQQLQPWVGLPNILCEGFVVPEVLQERANPVALARSLLEWLAAPERIAALEQRFVRLHEQLRRNTIQIATDAIDQVLAR